MQDSGCYKAQQQCKLQLPPGIYHSSKQQQLAYIRSLATQVVEECTLIDTNNAVAETDYKVYNYARVLCHYGHLYLNFGMLVWRVMVNVSFVVGGLCFHTSKQQVEQSTA